MFNNSGSKLKNIAYILFFINVIIFIVLAFVFGWTEHYSGYKTVKDFHPVLFFTLLIAGPIASYIECLIIYAIGEGVENSERSLGYLKNSYDRTNITVSGTTNAGSTNSSPVQKTSNAVKKTPKSFSVKTTIKNCPKCGEANSGNQLYCSNCGTHL